MQLIKPLAEKYPALQFNLLSMTSGRLSVALAATGWTAGICTCSIWMNACLRSPGCRKPDGTLHDKRHFDFSAGTPGWDTLARCPLAF